jgi:hypothetical protein
MLQYLHGRLTSEAAGKTDGVRTLILSSVLCVDLWESSIWPALRHTTPHHGDVRCKPASARACMLARKCHMTMHVTDRIGTATMPTANPPRLTCICMCYQQESWKVLLPVSVSVSELHRSACSMHARGSISIQQQRWISIFCRVLHFAEDSSLLTHCLTKLENLACLVYSVACILLYWGMPSSSTAGDFSSIG